MNSLLGKYRPTIILALALTVFLASCKGTSTTLDPTDPPGTTDPPGPGTKSWVVTTFASGFNEPSGVAVDSSDNLYVVDRKNNSIQKITPEGVVSPFASGFRQPRDLAVDSDGNVYVADTYNNRIRKITPAGAKSIFAGGGIPGQADGTGRNATFDGPFGVAVVGTGDSLLIYVADHNNHTIRRITSTRVVTTIAGTADSLGTEDGDRATARLHSPNTIAVDLSGNLYVVEDSNRIRKVTPTGDIATIAGDGTTAKFHYPFGVAVVGSGDNLLIYVADTHNNRIQKITSEGVVSTFPDTTAQFNSPRGMAVNSDGTILYVADAGNNRIRKIEYK